MFTAWSQTWCSCGYQLQIQVHQNQLCLASGQPTLSYPANHFAEVFSVSEAPKDWSSVRLYLYLLKILVLRTMPVGQINWFVSYACAVFMFFYFVLRCIKYTMPGNITGRTIQSDLSLIYKRLSKQKHIQQKHPSGKPRKPAGKFLQKCLLFIRQIHFSVFPNQIIALKFTVSPWRHGIFFDDFLFPQVKKT